MPWRWDAAVLRLLVHLTREAADQGWVREWLPRKNEHPTETRRVLHIGSRGAEYDNAEWTTLLQGEVNEQIKGECLFWLIVGYCSWAPGLFRRIREMSQVVVGKLRMKCTETIWEHLQFKCDWDMVMHLGMLLWEGVGRSSVPQRSCWLV